MPPQIKRAMYHAGHPKGPTKGKDVEIEKFAIHRYGIEHDIPGLLPKPEEGFSKLFGASMRAALAEVIQPREGIPATGNIGQATFNVLWSYLDSYRQWQYRVWVPPQIPKPKPKVPALGPLYVGGTSLLTKQLTHNTDGFPNSSHPYTYIAFDDGWIVGRSIIAPETMRVTEQSGSQGGDAFFAESESGLRWWFGHLAGVPATGAWKKKGERIGTIAWMPPQYGDPHVHCGIDAEPLIGHRLLYGRTGSGPDYTYGSPTLGAQLAEGMSLAA